MTDHNERFDRFVQHLLSVDPRNSYDDASHRARVFMQTGMANSALFRLDPDQVSAYLDKLTGDVGSLWPEASIELRTYRLLSIHLMESVRNDPDEVFELTVDGILPQAQ